MRIFGFIFKNFMAKVLSLTLAVLTWFYVFDVINAGTRRVDTTEEVLSKINFTVKEVPIRPSFLGKSPNGFKVNFRDVRVEPRSMYIFGPESILGKVRELATDKINLAEYTKTTELRVGLKSDVKVFRTEGKVVSVFLPVEKVKGEASTGAETRG